MPFVKLLESLSAIQFGSNGLVASSLDSAANPTSVKYARAEWLVSGLVDFFCPSGVVRTSYRLNIFGGSLALV